MCPDELKDFLFSKDILSEKEARQYSPLTLAFLGGAVYSLLVRNMLTKDCNKPTGKLHKESVKYVNASFQAEMIKSIKEELTEDEADIFKRGRNSRSNHSPKNQTDGDYRYATGLESLYGYLCLCGKYERINEIFNKTTYKEFLNSQEK